jgi:hypothetical protein
MVDAAPVTIAVRKRHDSHQRTHVERADSTEFRSATPVSFIDDVGANRVRVVLAAHPTVTRGR